MNPLSFLVIFGVIACASAFAPLLGMESKTKIEGRYIIVFHKNVTYQQSLIHVSKLRGMLSADEVIDHHWNIDNKFIGFSAKLSQSKMMQERRSGDVAFVEFDQTVSLSACSAQTNAEWGLDRISERDLDIDGMYTYDANSGENADAYVIDTGIYVAHQEFGGRAIWGNNFVDTNNVDCNGHGTHVAGTIGGTTYGVAKKTTLIGVKVLNCGGSGSWASVISGVEWSAAQSKTRKRPSVANMSLGGGKTAALDEAVKAAISAGLTFAVAAGNNNGDACNTSPANVNTAITVGATTIDDDEGKEVDARSSFSNFGTCVTLFAPGELVKSAWIGSVTATKTISGTSMASPHVAGSIALYLSLHPAKSPAHVKTHLTDSATRDKIQLECVNPVCNLSPNLLVCSECASR